MIPTAAINVRPGDLLTIADYPADVLDVRVMELSGQVSVLVKWRPQVWWNSWSEYMPMCAPGALLAWEGV